MPRILIANFNSEAMMEDRAGMTYEFACFTSIVATKHMWFAEPGDIVVLPEPLSKLMAEYVSRIKGFSILDEVRFLSPPSGLQKIGLVGFEYLQDGTFVEQLKRLMSGPRGWTLMPYYFDRSIAALARDLALPEGPGTAAFRLNGGHELFNDKRTFRSLAAARGIPLADGEICGSKEELLGAFNRLLDQTGAVIVKQNRHSCACGNLIVSLDKEMSRRGAFDISYITPHEPLERTVEMAWNRLASGGETYLIVEVYHPVQSICYAEFEIKETSMAPVFLNWGDQRMEPTFAGLEIPSAMPPFQAARFISGAMDLARLAKDVGFLGPLNVDGIVTESGRVLFNEINGRFGGSSHVHYLAELMIGPGYGDQVTVLTRNKIAAPHLQDVLEIMDAECLAFAQETGEGIILTGDDTARTGSLGIMAIGTSRARAESIETKFSECMALAADDRHVTSHSLSLEQTLH